MQQATGQRSHIGRALPTKWHRAAGLLLVGATLLLLFNVPVLISDAVSTPLSPLQLIAASVAVALTVWATAGSKPPSRELLVMFGFALMLGALLFLNGGLDAASVTGSDDTALITVHNHVLFIAVLVAFTLAFGSGDTHSTVPKVLLAAVLINAAYVFFEATTRISLTSGNLDWIPAEDRFRSPGLFEQPNVTAKFLILGLACTVTTVSRSWALPYFALVAAAIFLTGSRSNMLLTAILFVLASRHLFGTRSVIVLIYAGSLAALAYTAVSMNALSGLERFVGDNITNSAERIVERMQSGFDATDNSRDSRIEASKQAWQSISDYPLGGDGVQRFQTQVDQLDISPHNTYATQGVLFGLPGLVWLAALTAFAAIKARWRGFAFVSCFLGSCWFSGENLQDLFIAVMLAWTLATPAGRRWHHAGQFAPRSRRRRSRHVATPPPVAVHASALDTDADREAQRAATDTAPTLKPRRRRRRPRVERIDSLGTEDLDDLAL